MSGGAPTANDDSYTVAHDQLLIVATEEGVLANDSDPEADPLEAYLGAGPTHGSVGFRSGDISFGGDGGFQYLPEPGFVGADSFTYVVTDGVSESNTATVTITVTNQTPDAQADQYTISEGQVLEADGFGTASVLGNDFDADGDILRAQLVSDVSHGSLVFNDDGTFVYTPDSNFAGKDSFSYSPTDGIVSTLPVTVALTVQSGGPFDLDGWDLTTETTWMSEPDEQEYGLQADTQGTSQILLRMYDLPPDYVIDSRKVTWDPAKLSVNGVTQPGYIALDPDGGGEVFPVKALQQ
ncbi:MAG TPA: cadherin-like domain-containing protein, partial [Gemmataceae bacterium]